MRKSLTAALPIAAAVLAFAGLAIGQSVSISSSTGVLNSNGTITNQTMILPPGMTYNTTNGAGVLTMVYNGGPQLPKGAESATYHQVVDVYYDRDGNKLATASQTHTVGYDCHSGQRRQGEDLTVQDDGKGNVRFVQSRLPSEPMNGAKPVTAEGRAKALMAIRSVPTEHDTQTQLAAAK